MAALLAYVAAGLFFGCLLLLASDPQNYEVVRLAKDFRWWFIAEWPDHREADEG